MNKAFLSFAAFAAVFLGSSGASWAVQADHWTLDSSSSTLTDGEWSFKAYSNGDGVTIQSTQSDPGPNSTLDFSKYVAKGADELRFHSIGPGFKGYANRANLVKLFLPDYDVKIADLAFRETAIDGALDLTHVTSVGKEAFYGTRITSVAFGPNLTEIAGSWNGGAFMNCTSLTNVVFDPRSRATLATGDIFTFNGCVSLETADLSGVAVLKGGGTGRSPFKGCSALRTVIMSNLVSITKEVFKDSGAPADYHFYGAAPELVDGALDLGKSGGTTYVHLFPDDPAADEQLAGWSALTEGGSLNADDSMWKTSIAGANRPLRLVMPVHEHVWSEWKDVVPATGAMDGFRTRTCTVPGCPECERGFIPASDPVEGAIVYADADGVNPIPPYATRATAATTLADAIAAVSDATVEIHLTPGVYEQQSPAAILSPIRMIGDGAKPEDVVIRNANPSSSYGTMNWVLTVDNAAAWVANVTVENGIIVNAEKGYGAGITLKGGVVSNCVIRSCRAQNMGPLNEKNGISGGVLVAGANSLLTHSVVEGCRNTSPEGSNTKVASGAGATVTTGGRVSNCLFHDIDTPCGGVVSVYDGLIENSTIADCTVDKWKLGDACYGLCLTNGLSMGTARAVNVVIANVRKTGEEPENRAFCGLGASVEFSNIATDTAEPVGEACVTGSKETFFEPDSYVPLFDGPLWNAGAKTASAPAVDLAGNRRTVDKMDIGCFEQQKRPSFLLIVR